jgi:hypothetical protein
MTYGDSGDSGDIINKFDKLPIELIHKIFFYLADHPISVIFKDYRNHICGDITVAPYDDWPMWTINPLFLQSVRSYYRDQTYFRFHNALRRIQLHKKGKRLRRRREYYLNGDLAINYSDI